MEYRNKPIDFEKWEPCSYCYIIKCGTCKNFGTDDFFEPCNRCLDRGTGLPTYNRYSPINYCPYCGRPLTAEAQEMLERRLRGTENG